MSIAARDVLKFLQDVLKFLRDINPQNGGGSGGDDAQPFVPSDRLRRRLNSPVTLGPLMPQWTMSRILEASPISLGKFSGKLFVYSFFSYCAAALVWWVWSSFLESPLKDPLRETASALLWLPFLVLFYPFSFAAAYDTIFGERFVSHDVVIRYPISKEVLIAVFVFLALSLAARKLVLGRVLAYIFVAAFTLGAAVNWFAMIQQG